MEITIVQHKAPLISKIYIGHDRDLSSLIVEETKGKQVVIITDENVVPFVPLLDLDAKIFSFPAGESYKSRDTKEKLEDALLQNGFTRDTLLIGFGGGVTLDLVGYLASTFCRGVPFIAIPTTIIGMVDAAIGGKTGVNTPQAKNMIGTFHPAKLVVIDTQFIPSLPQEQWNEGLSEIVKYALIGSPSLFKELMDNFHAWKNRDPVFIRSLIEQSCAFKAEIVQKDPFETGIRRILNFGHTIGHALEIATHHQISHGTAVAIGMMQESRLSHSLGFLSAADVENLQDLYALYELPSEMPKDYNRELFLAALRLDKKNAQGNVRFVTLDAIGTCSSHEGNYCVTCEPSEALV